MYLARLVKQKWPHEPPKVYVSRIAGHKRAWKFKNGAAAIAESRSSAIAAALVRLEK